MSAYGVNVFNRLSGSPVINLNIPNISKYRKFKYKDDMIVVGGTKITRITTPNHKFFNGNLYLANPYPTNVQEIICKTLTSNAINAVLIIDGQ